MPRLAGSSPEKTCIGQPPVMRDRVHANSTAWADILYSLDPKVFAARHSVHQTTHPTDSYRADRNRACMAIFEDPVTVLRNHNRYQVWIVCSLSVLLLYRALTTYIFGDCGNRELVSKGQPFAALHPRA